jgi:hypothetical protein
MMDERNGEDQPHFKTEQGGKQQTRSLQGIAVRGKGAVGEQARADQKDNEQHAMTITMCAVIDECGAFPAEK